MLAPRLLCFYWKSNQCNQCMTNACQLSRNRPEAKTRPEPRPSSPPLLHCSQPLPESGTFGTFPTSRTWPRNLRFLVKIGCWCWSFRFAELLNLAIQTYFTHTSQSPKILFHLQTLMDPLHRWTANPVLTRFVIENILLSKHSKHSKQYSKHSKKNKSKMRRSTGRLMSTGRPRVSNLPGIHDWEICPWEACTWPPKFRLQREFSGRKNTQITNQSEFFPACCVQQVSDHTNGIDVWGWWIVSLQRSVHHASHPFRLPL